VWDTGKFHSFYLFFASLHEVPTYFDRQFSGSGSGILGSGTWCLFDPWIQDPGSRMGKKSGSGSGIKYLNSLMRICDGKNSDPGSEVENVGYWIRDKNPGSATLFTEIVYSLS